MTLTHTSAEYLGRSMSATGTPPQTTPVVANVPQPGNVPQSGAAPRSASAPQSGTTQPPQPTQSKEVQR